MTLTLALKLYGIAFALFIVVDLIWLGVVASELSKCIHRSPRRKRGWAVGLPGVHARPGG